MASLIKKGKTILLFFSTDNKPVAKKCLQLVKEDYELISQLGVSVLGISSNSTESNNKLADSMSALPFPLASDEKLELAKYYDVLDKTAEQYQQSVIILDSQGSVIHKETPFQPDDPNQYANIFQVLGFQ